ncbi:MAG: hypothetical protein ACTS80_01125 [Candidatus Hodgkinia cicadicola]
MLIRRAAGPQSVWRWLETFWNRGSPIMIGNGKAISKFSGDVIIFFWGKEGERREDTKWWRMPLHEAKQNEVRGLETCFLMTWGGAMS